MKRVLILGSTGSIGCNAIEVMKDLRDTHKLCGLSGHANHARLIEQATSVELDTVAVTDPGAVEEVRKALKPRGIEVLDGEGALCELIERLEPDIVLVAVTGAVGLAPSLAALSMGSRLALANKESLVMAGHILTRRAAEQGAEIIPVDSEHSAVFQALRGENLTAVERIVLTASGGPFADLPIEALRHVKPEDALKHPTWSMGKKISIDSATMMNKALEIVEARWLFDLPPEKIDVVVHRQSIVHGMAEFKDGSIIAHMGLPDMKVPIRFALTYPERSPSRQRYFDLQRCARLTFEAPDYEKFPALTLGFNAARLEGLAGTVLNGANEEAVELFLKGAISFDDITRKVGQVMDVMESKPSPTLEEIFAADKWSREELHKCI